MTLSDSISKTKEIAGDFLNTISKGEKTIVVGLKGDLGSGKTTFVKEVAKHLGLEQTISSPTFVIEKIYKLENQEFQHLIHIDAYRLKNGDELKTLGFEEVLKNNNNLIFIEWPENVKDILPKDTKYIEFEFIDDNKREINF